MTATAVFHKQRDGSVVLEIVRRDGTSTSEVHAGEQALAAARRQLGHWVVERGLRSRQGFYGLVTGSMDLAAFAATLTKGQRLPDELVVVEVVLELIDSMRQGLAACTTDEIDGFVAQACRRRGVRPSAQCTGVKVRELQLAIDELLSTWSRLPIGETLRLPLDW